MDLKSAIKTISPEDGTEPSCQVIGCLGAWSLGESSTDYKKLIPFCKEGGDWSEVARIIDGVTVFHPEGTVEWTKLLASALQEKEAAEKPNFVLGAVVGLFLARNHLKPNVPLAFDPVLGEALVAAIFAKVPVTEHALRSNTSYTGYLSTCIKGGEQPTCYPKVLETYYHRSTREDPGSAFGSLVLNDICYACFGKLSPSSRVFALRHLWQTFPQASAQSYC